MVRRPRFFLECADNAFLFVLYVLAHLHTVLRMDVYCVLLISFVRYDEE